MKKLKKAWGWLNGKKRAIGLVYWLAVVPTVDKLGDVPAGIEVGMNIFGYLLGALGIGHAAMKARKPKVEKPAEQPKEN